MFYYIYNLIRTIKTSFQLMIYLMINSRNKEEFKFDYYVTEK